MITTPPGLAVLAKDYSYITASAGERLKLDDPRVVHVLPLDFGAKTLELLRSVFGKRGWKCRVGTKTTSDTLQYAKELSNGRECLPCLAIMGETWKDILHHRKEGEVTLYYCLDQEGPCQNGSWPAVWKAVQKRKGINDVVFCTWPSHRTNYVGRGELFAVDIALSFIVGDILEEAEFTLRCLAENQEEGMRIFRCESDKVIESAKHGYLAIENSLRAWARSMQKVRLKACLGETPKVLLFGGANLLFSHRPVSDYFVSQGIIPKLVDTTEFVTWLESEAVTRYGFKIGLTSLGSQMRVLPMVWSLFNSRFSTSEGLQALRCRTHVTIIDFLFRRLRGICRESGVVYDAHIPFKTLYEEGSKHVSPNGFTESHINAARFIMTAKGSIFDGLVNVGAFNCQPAMNTQACVRWLANEVDIPYASIDCETPAISANQRRLLEVVAVQATRLRQSRVVEKAKKVSNFVQAPLGTISGYGGPR